MNYFCFIVIIPASLNEFNLFDQLISIKSQINPLIDDFTANSGDKDAIIKAAYRKEKKTKPATSFYFLVKVESK